ncbi:MAG: hypothetical protein ACLR1G_15960 [Alistipes indistinctus]
MKRLLLTGMLLLLGAAPTSFAQGAKDVVINELLVKTATTTRMPTATVSRGSSCATRDTRK